MGWLDQFGGPRKGTATDDGAPGARGGSARRAGAPEAQRGPEPAAPSPVDLLAAAFAAAPPRSPPPEPPAPEPWPVPLAEAPAAPDPWPEPEPEPEPEPLPAAPPAPAPSDAPRPRTDPERTPQMSTNIAATAEIAGFIGAALVDSESGLMLASEGGGRIDMEAAAALHTQVIKAELQAMEALGLDDHVEDILITMGKQIHMIRPLEKVPSVFLYVALDKRAANLGMARMQVKRIESGLSL